MRLHLDKVPRSVVILLVLVVAFALRAAEVPPPSPQGQLDRYWNNMARADLARRTATVAPIQTRAQAEQRRAWVRATVLRLIGGLPATRTPLHATTIGTVPEQGFHVERVIYDSLPGFHVTADLYLPDRSGSRVPAVIYTPGHYPAGKLEAWYFASNMARLGIAVLVYDPIGEGERLQYFDPTTGKSLAGPPTGEHSEAASQMMLGGRHIARYFIWDAMRGIDYLDSRPDIDPSRIGAQGCSGGGTVTAYLAALDPRVKAAGVACYITSFNELLPTLGPQEAEQTLPGFIHDGLGFPDWVEAAAPKPYAIISTSEDMFPFAGARHTRDEARRIYGLYGDEDHLSWINGPGHHGNLRPIMGQIIGFYTHWLLNSDQTPALENLPPPPPQTLLCTKTGQVSDSLGGETAYSLSREETPLPTRTRPLTNDAALAAFRQHIAAQVRAAAVITAKHGSTPPGVRIITTEQKSGWRLETISWPSDTGVENGGLLAVPDAAGKKPAVLLLTPDAPTEADLEHLAASGHVVFAPQMLPGPKDYDSPKSHLMGPWYEETLRACLVGKTLVGIRADDVIAAMDWLAAQPDVDPGQIAATGIGPMGIVLLHAAVLDPRIHSVTLDHTLTMYRTAFDDPAPRDLAQSVVPGVLQRYDLDDLIAAIAPRTVTVTNPVDGEEKPVTAEAFRQQFAWVFDSARNLHHPDQLQVVIAPDENPAPGNP
ncbi:MAG TPA: acetylxylan esterase [Acidobacteriaceae bacterium]|jgi:dienelactone hydrolase|nr:acetylxylan esterase [Acidobacteriaceae bacterium]